MSTTDDPSVKSKLPMRWTLRQATGEMPRTALVQTFRYSQFFWYVGFR